MSDLGNNAGVGSGDAIPPPLTGGIGTPATGTTGGPPPNIQQLVASKRLQQAQAQVGEVVDIMRVNVEKVLERDQKISELDRRADDLQEGASQFQQQAVKLKRKYWWENIKMWLIIGVILLVVIVIVVLTTTGNGTGSTQTETSAEEAVLDSDAVNSSLPSEGVGSKIDSDNSANTGVSGDASGNAAQNPQPASTGNH